jgi:putative Ca2+/H+ antiporter (TMEM165/GDT1 family)
MAPVEALLVSTLAVGLAEIGDKTQLLSLMLAARYRRPVPVLFGILFATLANHAGAGLIGVYLGSTLNGPWIRWLLALSFFSVAVWALFPDRCEGGDKALTRAGAFAATLIAFFFAEVGDKTQIVTLGLAARFAAFYPVVAGTTLGMMLANIPVVLAGDRIAGNLPARALRVAAALLFAALGVITLVGAGR